jgi:hypothetical protein
MTTKHGNDQTLHVPLPLAKKRFSSRQRKVMKMSQGVARSSCSSAEHQMERSVIRPCTFLQHLIDGAIEAPNKRNY